MRRVSCRTAPSRAASAAERPAVSVGMVQYPVEGIEVAPAPVDVEPRKAAIHDERHPLLREAAVRAQRRIETGEIVLRRCATDDDRPLGNDHEVADAIG